MVLFGRQFVVSFFSPFMQYCELSVKIDIPMGKGHMCRRVSSGAVSYHGTNWEHQIQGQAYYFQ